MNSITKKLLLTGVFAFAMAPTPTSVARNHSLANTIANNAAKILGGVPNENALIADMASAHAQLKKADPKKANEVLNSINHPELANTVSMASVEAQMAELRAQLEEDEENEAIRNQINALNAERGRLLEIRRAFQNVVEDEEDEEGEENFRQIVNPRLLPINQQQQPAPNNNNNPQQPVPMMPGNVPGDDNNPARQGNGQQQQQRVLQDDNGDDDIDMEARNNLALQVRELEAVQERQRQIDLIDGVQNADWPAYQLVLNQIDNLEVLRNELARAEGNDEWERRVQNRLQMVREQQNNNNNNNNAAAPINNNVGRGNVPGNRI